MEQLTPLLNELAAQLNTTVEFLWSVLLRQAQVEVIKGIIFWLLWIIALVFTVWWTRYSNRKIEDNSWDDDIRWTGALLIFILTIGFVLNALFLNSTMDALLNPEYWALQQILEVIR